MSSEGSGIDIHIPRRLSWVTVGGFIIIVASVVAGYLSLQSTVSGLANALTELSETTAANREFQIEQRVRVWDRVNQLEAAVQAQREVTAGIQARLDAIDRSLDRVLDILENR